MAGRHPPAHPSRRQSDWHQQQQYQHQQYAHQHPHQQALPPQYYAHQPQAQYYMPYPAPYAQQAWYPPQYAMPQHHHPRYQHQAPPPPPPPQHHYSPLVVSSHPQFQSPVMNHHMATTPPIVHAHHPSIPAIPSQQTTGIPAPPTPSVSSQAAASPRTPTTATTTVTPPPVAQETPTSTPPTNASTPKLQFVSARQVPATPQKPSPLSREIVFGDRGTEEVTRRGQSPFPWQNDSEFVFPARARRKQRKKATVGGTPQLALSALNTRLEGEAEESDDAETIEKPSQVSKQEVGGATVETPAINATPVESSQGKLPVTSKPEHSRSATIPAIPLLPVRAAPKSAENSSAANAQPADVSANDTITAKDLTQDESVASETASVAAVPAKPKSWADMARKGVNGVVSSGAQANGATLLNGTGSGKSSMTDVLRAFNPDSEARIQFLEPRGLVNTGNMCYMNSILQTLVFCTPFYNLLSEIKRRVTLNLSVGSKTSLVEAMIDFMGEFTSITSADSVEELKLRLKEQDFATYGAPFTPDALYEVIKTSPRFTHMRRGHQQDAEEFLNHLFEGLHEEFAQAIAKTTGDSSTVPSSGNDEEWSEVGRKQKAAVTHSTGEIDLETPVTKIFGGKQRSVLRKGGKESITFERFQHLALHIASPDVSSIVDALKHLSRSENVGVDGGPRQMKQTFIETLPPVLILHLKRFGYDTIGGAQKIWKKVGYPLELEMPGEVFPPAVRNTFLKSGGLPRYRLVGVVYHHGKNASGGHYTVDVRRQDREEWVRIDDTYIQRVTPRTVAEGGSAEDPKVLAAALEQHKRDQSQSNNIYELAGLDEEKEHAEEGIWKEKAAGSKKWTGVVNGTATPSSTGRQTPHERSGFKDNKVAYVLMYQRIRS